MSRDDAPMGSILAGLGRFFPDDEWAVRIEVPSSTGPKDGVRIADLLAVHLWPERSRSSGGWLSHMVEIKQSLADFRRDADHPEKSAPARAICACWWFAVPPDLVGKVRPFLPLGWGLLSCGPGKPRIMEPAPAHDAERPSFDVVRALLRARPLTEVHAPAPLAKILPRRVPRVERTPVTKLSVALDAIAEASADQLVEIEAALAARRAA